MNSSASPLLAPGAIVAGKYRLDAVIGEGGMGSVWSATHTGLGQAVAIKFISKEFVTSAEALRRFDAEAKAAAQLRSRYVVQVYDNGTLEDGTPYIAMELLRGESVYARVHRAGPVPLQEAVEILLQCCKALSRAHAAGIVHRDIKPDNIFLSQSQDDDALAVKVLDFGIAKFSGGPNDHGATRTGAVLGTPLYMSPEQARGLKTIDFRTDIYSLGLVAYTMLTGNLAFSSESFGDLLLQICTAPLPSLRANAPWVPVAVEGWFFRACAREPSDRYGSAQEMAEALRAACGGAVRSDARPSLDQSTPGHGVAPYAPLPVAATASAMSRSGVAADPVVTPKSRAPVIAMAAAVAAVVGGVAVAAVVTMSRRSADPSPAAAPPAPTSRPVSQGSGAVAAPPPVATLSEPAPAALSGADAGFDRPRPAATHRTGADKSQAPSAASAQPSHPAPVRSPAPAPAPREIGHPAQPSGGTIDLGY